jgi:SnoaL-like domain
MLYTTRIGTSATNWTPAVVPTTRPTDDGDVPPQGLSTNGTWCPSSRGRTVSTFDVRSAGRPPQIPVRSELSVIDELVERWLDYRRTHAMDALDELLDDSVTYHSPIRPDPIVGKELAARFIVVAITILPDRDIANPSPHDQIRYTKQLAIGDTAMLEFEGDLHGTPINGVQVMRGNAAGRIVEFRLFVRPLAALRALEHRARAAFEGL